MMGGERPAIYGTGEQTRDYIYVSDAVGANVAALRLGGGQILNVSTGRATSVNDMLREMCLICRKPFEPEYGPARPGDIPNSVLENRLAMQELNWVPVYSLRDGLFETLQFYERQVKTGR